jgi:CRISPR/Cas system CSM-associated protein Csm3 (group 7 of RAMP superfamily)
MAIGSGFPRGQVDRSVVQRLNGLPYIPASTLKGRVRDMAERLLQTFGHKDICNGPLPDFMCPANAKEPCLICRTFGTTGLSSMSGHTGLIWRDAPACENDEKELSPKSMHEANNYFYTRTQVQLSRPRGVALAKHLFTTESTIENLLFKGRVRGWLPKTTERFSDELLLLCAALKLLCFIGGGKSRGAGQCSVKLHQHIAIDDENIPVAEVFQEIERLNRR